MLKIQNTWNAILATSEKVVDGEHFCLPSKIFDVVNSKKRILAFVTSGSQEKFLKEYPQSVFLNPDNVEGSSKLLKKVINEGYDFTSKSLDNSYSRHEQSQKLLSILANLKH